MDWGKETQGIGTHEGPLAVVQVEIGTGKVGRKKKRHMGERDWGSIINRIWQLILHVHM